MEENKNEQEETKANQNKAQKSGNEPDISLKQSFNNDGAPLVPGNNKEKPGVENKNQNSTTPESTK